MTSGQPSWILSDGLPRWRPLLDYVDRAVDELPWLTTGNEYLSRVAEMRTKELFAAGEQLKGVVEGAGPPR